MNHHIPPVRCRPRVYLVFVGVLVLLLVAATLAPLVGA